MVFDLKEVVDDLAVINDFCEWDSLSEQALEFFYIDSELEEYLDDETGSEVVRLAVWADIGFSCLYQMIYHLLDIRWDYEKDSDGYQTYTQLITDYRRITKIISDEISNFELEY